MRFGIEGMTFVLEDLWEVGIQFFYFEKYAFLPNDKLVYFNAVFMILKSLELTMRVIMAMKKEWKYKKSFR